MHASLSQLRTESMDSQASNTTSQADEISEDDGQEIEVDEEDAILDAMDGMDDATTQGYMHAAHVRRAKYAGVSFLPFTLGFCR